MRWMAALVLSSCATAQDFEAFKKRSFEREDQGEWKKIAWQKTMDEALKKAQAENKPILVFLVVGERGRKNAPEC